MSFIVPFVGGRDFVLTFRSSAANSAFSNMAIGPADEGRWIVVAVGCTPARTVTAMTVGGVAATKLAGALGNVAGAEIWMALVPTGTTATVAVTFSGSTQGNGIALYSLLGPDSAGAYDTATGVTGSVVSANIDVPASGCVVAICHAQNNPEPNITITAGVTSDAVFSTGNQGKFRAGSASYATAQINLLVQMSVVGGGNPNTYPLAVAAFGAG